MAVPIKEPTARTTMAGGVLLIALTLLCLLASPAHARPERLRVGYFRVTPHAMPDADGSARGVAVDYFKRIAARMGIVHLEFRLFPLERLLMALATGQVDMALLLGKNAQREATFVYPRQPFCFTQPCIAVASDSPLTGIHSGEPLRSLTIQESSMAFRSPFIRENRIPLQPLHGDNYTTRCFAKLLAGRIDACYQPDHYPLMAEADQPRFFSRIRILKLPEPSIGLYSVFSAARAADCLAAYEAALADVAREFTYEAAYEAFKRSSPAP